MSKRPGTTSAVQGGGRSSSAVSFRNNLPSITTGSGGGGASRGLARGEMGQRPSTALASIGSSRSMADLYGRKDSSAHLEWGMFHKLKLDGDDVNPLAKQASSSGLERRRRLSSRDGAPTPSSRGGPKTPSSKDLVRRSSGSIDGGRGNNSPFADTTTRCRQGMIGSITSRIHTAAAVHGETFQEKKSCTTVTEKSKNRSWKNMYNDRCESEAAQRSEVRAKRDFERKNYKPVVYDFSWLYAKNEVEAVVAPEPWQPTWNRNLYCEKCWALTTPGAGRVECITCPVVQHIGCAFQYSDEVPDVWMCDECVGTMEDSINRQKNAAADKRAVELSQRSAVLLQRQIRMFVKARFFRKLMYYVCFFQGLVRGFLTRKDFCKRFATAYRPFRVRIVSAENLTSVHDGRPAEATVILTILRNEDGDPTTLADGQGTGIDNQTHRHDSNSEKVTYTEVSEHHHMVEVGSARWNESIMVPCSTCQIMLAFTVHSFQKAQNEQEVGTAEFIGQALLDVHDAMLYSKKLSVTLPLGQFKVEPQDRGSQKTTRLQNTWRKVRGEITVEVEPSSHVTSQCGYLDEVTNAYTRMAPKKKWWAVLVEGALMLQLRPSDQKTKAVLQLRAASVKYHKIQGGGGVIEIRAPEGSFMLTCQDSHERKKWHSKMKASTAAGREASAREASELRANCQRIAGTYQQDGPGEGEGEGRGEGGGGAGEA